MGFCRLLGVATLVANATPLAATASPNAPVVNESPQVSNVQASVDATAGTVTIQFDLEDAEQDVLEIALRISSDGGASFHAPPGDVRGDVGFPVHPGSRTLVWEYDAAALELPATLQAKIVAGDRRPVDLQGVVDLVDPVRLRNDVESLQGVRHYSGNLANILAAKDFIESEFVAHGLQASRQAVPHAWPGENIIGRHAGMRDEDAVFIVDGHFDTVTNTPGADDNASGTAGMLEAMRVLSPFRFAKTIKFIGFDLEEVGIVGSRHYAANIPEGERVEGIFNFEMIGYTCTTPSCDAFRDVGDYIHNIGDPNSDALRLAFDAAASTYAPDLSVLSTQGDRSDTNLRRSDHIGFWDRDIPGLFITDGANFRNPHYHRATDTSATLNYEFMANIVKTTVATVAQFAEIGAWGAGTSEDFTIPVPTAVVPTSWSKIKGPYR